MTHLSNLYFFFLLEPTFSHFSNAISIGISLRKHYRSSINIRLHSQHHDECWIRGAEVEGAVIPCKVLGSNPLTNPSLRKQSYHISCIADILLCLLLAILQYLLEATTKYPSLRSYYNSRSPELCIITSTSLSLSSRIFTEIMHLIS